MTERSFRPAGWELPILLVMAAAGLGIAVYLTLTHSGSVPLVCTIGAAINCAAVTHSAYSLIPGTSIPISVLGIVWFVVSGALAMWATRQDRLRLFHLAWAGLGLAVVLYLIYVEIVILHQICEWCTVAHLLVIATFVVALYRVQRDAA